MRDRKSGGKKKIKHPGMLVDQHHGRSREQEQLPVVHDFIWTISLMFYFLIAPDFLSSTQLCRFVVAERHRIRWKPRATPLALTPLTLTPLTPDHFSSDL